MRKCLCAGFEGGRHAGGVSCACAQEAIDLNAENDMDAIIITDDAISYRVCFPARRRDATSSRRYPESTGGCKAEHYQTYGDLAGSSVP